MRQVRQFKAILGAIAAVLVIATAGAVSARDERVVAIGDHEMILATAGDDCFLDPGQPADQALTERLAKALGDEAVLLLVFADCRTLEGWRSGVRPILARFGYLTIAEVHLEPVFAFDQQALATAIEDALKARGAIDYRADIGRLAADLETALSSLPAGGRHDLGIAHRDRFGPVQASVLSVVAPDGPPIARTMLQQSVLVAGKVLNVVATRDYDNADTVFDTYGDLSSAVEATVSRN